jgi:hypothetical protein
MKKLSNDIDINSLIKYAKELDELGFYSDSDFLMDSVLPYTTQNLRLVQAQLLDRYGNPLQKTPTPQPLRNRGPAPAQFRQLYPMGLHDPSLPRPTAPTTAPRPVAYDPIPKSFNVNDANAYRQKVIQNPQLRPGLAAQLELAEATGKFNPATGEILTDPHALDIAKYEKLQAQQIANQQNRANKIVNQVSQNSDDYIRGFTKFLNTKLGQKIIPLIQQFQTRQEYTINLLSRSLPAPAQAAMKKLPYVFIALNAVSIVMKLKNGEGVDYKTFMNFIAAIITVPAISAVIAAIPIIGPALIVAAGVVSFGGLDFAEFFGDPAAGLNLLGFQVTGPSKVRQTELMDFRTTDISKYDPAVQVALKESVPLIQSGQKISDILTNPTLLQNHPWLRSNNDIRYKQFIGAMGTGKFYVNTKNQPKTQNQQQNNPQAIQNHRQLLYKAYVDTVGNKTITLDNLMKNRPSIEAKIKVLAPQYGIDANQAITSLHNTIRKYGGTV